MSRIKFPRNLQRLSDWDALDLYSDRHLLSVNEGYDISREVEFRAERDEEFAYEASRR